MLAKNDKGISPDVKPRISRSRKQKIIYTALGVLLLFAVAGGILLTSYPNTIIHYVVEPKLKQFVVDRLGRRYSLQMNSITLSPNKDSLILTGVRIVDNGKADDGSTDTSSPDFGVATPLDRFSTDTVVIATLDYWKLILQKGLFAGTITVRSPKIYLRPGVLPKFASNSDLLPSFLPAVSSKIIKIVNAKIYFSEGKPASQAAIFYDGKSALPKDIGGLLVQNASLEFHDFYLDEPTYKKAISTFFCKSATFHAEDILHVDSVGITDVDVASVDGDLIDSSLHVFSIQVKKPIEEIRQTTIRQIELTGLDWYSALAGHGLHAKSAIIAYPQIYLQDIAELRPYSNSYNHVSASDLIPLPSLLPDIEIQSVMFTNAEVYALLPESHTVSALKRITMSLRQLKVDSSTPFANISSFFSQSARYGIKGESNLNTSLGSLKFAQIDGTEKSVTFSDITLSPSLKGLKLVRLKSVQIRGVDIWKILTRQGLVSSSLLLTNPKIYLTVSATPPITTLNSVLESDPLATIRDFKQYPLPLLFPEVSIGSITVSKGEIHGIHFFEGSPNPTGPGDSLTHVDLSLKNFKLDQQSWTHRRGTLFSDAGTFRIGAMKQLTQGAVYSYSEGGIIGDLRKRTLTIDTVRIHPLISEDSFGAAFKYRTERFDLIAPHIFVGGVDYQKLFLGNGIFADSILINSWRMHIYGDRRKPEEVRTSIQKYPHEIFQQIRTPIGINSIFAREGNISFRESWPDTTEPGTIIMNHVNAHIGNISNDTSNGGQTKPTQIDGDLKLMGEGFLSYNLTYQLMNPEISMNIHGHAGSMDASVLNNYLALTEPFTLSGVVESADFNIDIKNNYMTGILIPQYDSLHVKFFRWDKFPPGLVSFLANALFMRSHNTSTLDHPLHQAEISAEIDRSTSLFWAIWLPIRSGIGSIIRIPEWVW